jgi:hypothetical protein
MNETEGPPQICGAMHPRYTNVGPCQIYAGEHGHMPTLFPHRGIAEGVVEVGWSSKEQRPIMAHRRWWSVWFDEPRDPIVPDFVPHERKESLPPVLEAYLALRDGP